MMGNTGNAVLVNGMAGSHEQQVALSQQSSCPSHQAQINTPGQEFSPLKTRRMRTNSTTPQQSMCFLYVSYDCAFFIMCVYMLLCMWTSVYNEGIDCVTL